MSIVDDLNALIPVYHDITRVSFQRDGGSIVACWDIRILNEDGVHLTVLHPELQPPADLRQALVAWYLNCVEQLETITDLTEWPGGD
jgi:hypothetical protein